MKIIAFSLFLFCSRHSSLLLDNSYMAGKVVYQVYYSSLMPLLLGRCVGMVGRWFVGVEDGTGRTRWPLWAFCCCLVLPIHPLASRPTGAFLWLMAVARWFPCLQHGRGCCLWCRLCHRWGCREFFVHLSGEKPFVWYSSLALRNSAMLRCSVAWEKRKFQNLVCQRIAVQVDLGIWLPHQ